LTVCNRTKAKAEELAISLRAVSPSVTIKVADWDHRSDIVGDIVVNTTSLGMTDSPALDFSFKADNAYRIAADIVYKPLVTRFLNDAQEQGLLTVSGLDMLMYQAVPGFHRWFGKTPVVDEALRSLLLSHINGTYEKGYRTIGLTGSIGMGKSTVATMFADEGVPVWDADASVHRLYSPGGAGVAALAHDFGDCIVEGLVDRAKLGAHVLQNVDAMGALEAIIHPLVALDRQLFLRTVEASGHKICLLDIPLLFEGEMSGDFDHVAVVSAPADVQRERVLARPGMTAEKFDAITARQMPDDQKRSLADTIIATDRSLDKTRAQVRALLRDLTDTR